VVPTGGQMGYIPIGPIMVQRVPVGVAAGTGGFVGSRALRVAGTLRRPCLRAIVKEQAEKAAVLDPATLQHVEGRPLLLFQPWQEEQETRWQLRQRHHHQ
jgi:hypothetical protein